MEKQSSSKMSNALIWGAVSVFTMFGIAGLALVFMMYRTSSCSGVF